MSASGIAVAIGVLNYTGYSVTNNGRINITGTTGADVIVGTSGYDSIIAGDGNDTITGAAGADYINGGAGDDIIIYSSVSDMTDDYYGSSQNALYETQLSERVNGGAGTDTIRLTAPVTITWGKAFYAFVPETFEVLLNIVTGKQIGRAHV